MKTPVKATTDFEKVQDTLDLITKAASKMQFKAAQGEMQVLLTDFPGSKSALKTFNNTLTSINEGLRDGHLTRRGAAAEIELANTKLKDDIAHATKQANSPSKFDPEVLYKDLSPDTLKVYDKNLNQVQVQLNRSGMFTGYVPVIPITHPPLSVEKLKKVGIAADNFAGYCVLKKQFVAGINMEQIHKMQPKLLTPGLSPTKAKAMEEEALAAFKEIIEKKYKHLKLIQMGHQTGWWGAYWFWFISGSEFKLMKSCTISQATVQSLSVQSWGFPFHR